MSFVLAHPPLHLGPCVVGSQFEAPEVRLHGFLAVGLVTLREEVLGVRGDLGEVFLAGCDSSGNGSETCPTCQLFRQDRSGTFSADGSELQAGCFGELVNGAKFLRDLTRYMGLIMFVLFSAVFLSRVARTISSAELFFIHCVGI